jgi:hypothetical protein
MSDRTTVSVTDFGYSPGSGLDATPAVAAAVQQCRATGATVLVFPPGNYDFWPDHAEVRAEVESNTYALAERACAVVLDGMDGLEIDGGGSSLLFHGRVQPLSIIGSSNIAIRDLSIDFPVPFLGQATVVAATPERVVLAVDPETSWRVEDERLVVIGEGWDSIVAGYMEFDAGTRRVAAGTGDEGCFQPVGQKYKVTDEGDGTIALHHAFTRTPNVGNVVVLRHSVRNLSGVFIDNSTDVVLDRVAVHHSPGISVLAQHSRNLTFKSVTCAPSPESGRIFAGHADGIHVSGCAGLVEVLDCSFAGLMDDPVNVHGTYLTVVEASHGRLRASFAHDMSLGLDWAAVGERVAVLDAQTLAKAGTLVIDAVHPQPNGDVELEFSGDLAVQPGHILENRDRCPDVTVRDSVFGNGRARGLLLSTRGTVRVERNSFSSSGAAILVAGDTMDWYESGAVRDVTIDGNHFDDACLTSPYQFGEAVISIVPTLRKVDARNPYHRGITVTNNTAVLAGAAFLYAQSCEGLTVTGNRISAGAGEPVEQPRTDLVTLEACSDVTVAGNVLASGLPSYDVMADGELLGRADAVTV